MILLNDYFEDSLGFSISSICLKILKKGGLLGFINSPMSEKNINSFLERNSENVKLLQKEISNVFVEKY